MNSNDLRQLNNFRRRLEKKREQRKKKREPSRFNEEIVVHWGGKRTLRVPSDSSAVKSRNSPAKRY